MQRQRLFVASCISLVTTSMVFAIRGDVAGPMSSAFQITNEQMGLIFSPAFWAFTIAIFISGALVDMVGMRALHVLSAIGYFVGIGLVLVAPHPTAPVGHIFEHTGTTLLYAGFFVMGLSQGLVEGVINPLVATIYSDQKTKHLNMLHAWWPGGLVIGGLTGVAMSAGGLGWQAKLFVVILPALAVVALSVGIRFPPTERAAAGVSIGEMFRELLNPLFLVLFCAMFLTAATELAPGQWVDFALSRTVHMPGILLLVYVSALMFVMRHFAGPLVHKLSPIGLLWASCLMGSLGLVALAAANSPLTGLLAATIWGTGVCYMWPTMLATASERFPRGGALLMGLMGTAGTLSIRFVLPMMGSIYDAKKIEVAGGEAAFAALPAGPELERVLGIAAQTSFRAVAILPAALLIVFGAIWLFDRRRGGFRPQKIS